MLRQKIDKLDQMNKASVDGLQGLEKQNLANQLKAEALEEETEYLRKLVAQQNTQLDQLRSDLTAAQSSLTESVPKSELSEESGRLEAKVGQLKSKFKQAKGERDEARVQNIKLQEEKKVPLLLQLVC